MKQAFHKVEQIGDLLHNDDQNDDEAGESRHRRLLLSAGTDKDLIQNGNDDPDGGDFEDQIDIHASHQQDRDRRAGAEA